MTATQHHTLQAMHILVEVGVPVLLWGDPGTGKTQTVQRYATDAGWHIESVIASLHEPTDFGGLPVRTSDGVTFEPPAWARRVAAQRGRSLVFFDEINTATPATQNALMRVVLEGRVGELDLGGGVRFVAAANPPEQNAGAWDLSAPLANRFGHLVWPVTINEWKHGFAAGWPAPAPLQITAERTDKHYQSAKAMITAFLSARPEQLLAVPGTDAAASVGWPSPRTWQYLASCEAVSAATGVGDDVRFLLAVALIGEAAALEYTTYLRDTDLIDPHELIADPAMFSRLGRSDQQFAALEAVTALAKADPKSHWKAAFGVCVAAANAGVPDIAATAATTLMEIKPSGAGLPAGFEVFAQVLTDAGLLETHKQAA